MRIRNPQTGHSDQQINMGDIIQINFNGPAPQKEESLREANLDFTEALSGALQKSGVGKLLPELALRSFLHKLYYNARPEIILTHREGLSDYSLEQLRGIVKTTSETQWKQNPSYYYALLAEISAKGGL